MLCALIEGVKDLPGRMEVLLVDGVSRVRVLRVHVIDETTEPERSKCKPLTGRHHPELLSPLWGQAVCLRPPGHHRAHRTFVKSVADVALEFESVEHSSSAFALDEPLLDLVDPSKSCCSCVCPQVTKGVVQLRVLLRDVELQSLG